MTDKDLKELSKRDFQDPTPATLNTTKGFLNELAYQAAMYQLRSGRMSRVSSKEFAAVMLETWKQISEIEDQDDETN